MVIRLFRANWWVAGVGGCPRRGLDAHRMLECRAGGLQGGSAPSDSSAGYAAHPC